LCFPSASGKVNFDGFCRIAAHFLEEEDSEAMQEELKEAFRLYDREGELRKTYFGCGRRQRAGQPRHTSPGVFLEESKPKEKREKEIQQLLITNYF
jgi:hypothetical protein